MTNVICESLKESYRVQEFMSSQIMETSEKYLPGLVLHAKGHTLGPSRQDDF